MPLIGLTRYRVQKWMWMYIFLCVLSSLKSQDNSFTGKSSHKRIKHSATVCTQHASHTKKRMHMRPIVRVCVCECSRGLRVQVRVTKGQLFSPSHSHFLCPKLQSHTDHYTTTHKTYKGWKDLYSPQLKTSLGKRRKFSQRIGTPHCSERYKYTHIHTHTTARTYWREHTLAINRKWIIDCTVSKADLFLRERLLF